MRKKNGVSIFIVDDDKMVTKAVENSIQEVFKRKDVETFKFEAGETCLDKIKKGYPQIMILDYNLNGKFTDAMSGVQVLKRVKKISPETDVIILTGEDNINTALETLHNGAIDYIVKSQTMSRKINFALLNCIKKNELERETNKYRKLTITFLLSAMFLLGILLTLMVTRSDIF